MKTFASWLSVTFLGLVLGGCAAVGAGSGGAGETQIRSGKIEQITLTQMPVSYTHLTLPTICSV